MWIRIDDVICNTDRFAKFCIKMNNDQYDVIGEQSANCVLIFTSRNNYYSAKAILDNLYAAMERGDRTFTIPNKMY